MNPFKSLLTYRAFRPDPLDIEETLSERFRLRRLGTNRLVALSVGRTHWRAAVATFDKAGAASFSEIVTSPNATNREALNAWLAEYATQRKLKHVAVGMGHGFHATPLADVPRGMTDSECMRILREEPARLFGDGVVADDAYVVAYNPHVDTSSIQFRIKASELAPVREVCAAAGLLICRLVCEQVQLIELAYSRMPEGRPDFRGILLTQPSSSLLIPLGQGGTWGLLHYDPDLDEQAVGNIHSAVEEVLPDNGKMAYIDTGMNSFGDLLHVLAAHNPTELFPSGPSAAFSAIVLN